MSNHKRLTSYKQFANLCTVNREDILSKKRLKGPLDEFTLFYEEIIKTAPITSRLRRIRQQSEAGANAN